MTETKNDQDKSLLVVNESNDAHVILYIYSGWSPFCATSTVSKIIQPKQKYLYREKTSFKFQLVAKFNNKEKGNDLQAKCEEKENEEEKEEQKKNEEREGKEERMENKEQEENKEQNGNEEQKKNEEQSETGERHGIDKQNGKEGKGRKEGKLKRKKENLLGPLELCDDKLIMITESLKVRQENLADFPNEKRVCLRKINREKELGNAAGTLSLYEILSLDMEKIRRLEKDAANKVIEKAFKNQIRIWHPDKNFGDGEIAMQIICAREILLDDARRARYHNGVDYDKGWFSFKRWKSIFWPECCSKEQNAAFWRRICKSAVSLGLAVGGVVLSACTAGTAAPVVAMCGAIFGAGCTVGGGQSLMYAVSKESIVDGCETKKWAEETAKGFAIGGITGGFAAAYTATTAAAEVATNLGEKPVECACEMVKTGLKRIAGNVVKAMPSKIAGTTTQGIKHFAYERLDDFVENQPPLDHLTRGVKNLICDVAVSAVSKEFAVAKRMIKGEPHEDCPKISNGGKIEACLEADKIYYDLLKSGTKTALEGMTALMENRSGGSEKNGDDLNDGVGSNGEQKEPEKKRNISQPSNLSRNETECDALHAANKEDGERPDKQTDQTKKTICGEAERQERINPNEQGSKKSDDKKGDRLNEMKCNVVLTENALVFVEDHFGDSETFSTYQQGYKTDEQACNHVHSTNGQVDEEEIDFEFSHGGVIRYISKGDWYSRMIVAFISKGKSCTRKVSVRMRVYIPADATNIEVKFQVSRPHWGFIKKYDRFSKTWCLPYETHVFRYDRPPIRTFTISGNLWWEAVMTVSDEYHEETKEMS
ncbi:uncharacterized protein LOC114533455 [Dendronephthya gigantea]|uniref:uncharacterized protein LOC114533455 n=1 Tax=Dendronephthya gigantea TaxID=151771 RepID=UPI00106A55AF|nr:uncharacterized protein LOC114533455 [Dendronephthya gigantea]